jgi:hypothetical protein
MDVGTDQRIACQMVCLTKPTFYRPSRRLASLYTGGRHIVFAVRAKYGIHRERLNQTRFKVEDFSSWPRKNFGLEPV